MQACCFSTSSDEPSPKVVDSVELRPISDIRYRFGVIADVQFAPKLDAPNYSRTRVRRFHHAVGSKGLVKAIDTWNTLYDTPIPLLPKGNRNPLVGFSGKPIGSGKPMGCMCETEFCKSRKCYNRAERLAGHSQAIFRAGVHVRHLSPSSASDSIDTNTEFIPARPMDSVLQLGDIIDGSNSSLKSFVYAPPQKCPKDCPYCAGTSEPLSLPVVPAEEPTAEVDAEAALFLKHMSPLQPPPCPVLTQAIHRNINDTYNISLAKYASEVQTHDAADVKPPSYATSLALASVYERVARARCGQWHHLLGNHELYNLVRALVYPLFGRGVKHGSLIPDEGSLSAASKTQNEVPEHDETEVYDPKASHHKYDAVGKLGAGASFPVNPPTAPEDPYGYFHYYLTKLSSPHSALDADSASATAPATAAAAAGAAVTTPAPAPTPAPVGAAPQDGPAACGSLAPAPATTSASMSVTVAVDAPAPTTYYLIVLDAYRLALMGTPQTHKSYVDSKAFLAEHNPNIRDGKTGDWSVGLKGEQMRFVPFNGALGSDQLAWLDNVLRGLPKGARAIVACHVSAQPDSTGPSTTLWDREELLLLFREHPGKVCLYMSGHDHDGGYAYDSVSQTHHLTVAAPIECRPDEEAFAVMDLYDDGCQVYGSGKIPDMFLSFDGCTE